MVSIFDKRVEGVIITPSHVVEMTPNPTKARGENSSIGFVSGIDVKDDDIVFIVDVTEGSFIEWIEQEVSRGSFELEL